MTRRVTVGVIAAAAAVLFAHAASAGTYAPRGLKFDPVEVKFTDQHTSTIAPGVTTTYYGVVDMRFGGWRCGDGLPSDKWVLGWDGAHGTGTVHEYGHITYPDGSQGPWDATADNFGGILTPGQSGLLGPTGYSGLVTGVINPPSPGYPSQTTLTVTHKYSFDQEYTESQTVPLSLVRNPDCPDQYRIELKAWIPKAHAVDPILPVPLPYPLIPRVGCYTPPTAADRATAIVSTLFRGDAHTDYDGSYRVNPWISFQWNGSQMTNFQKSPDAQDYGTTHLDWTFKMLKGRTEQCATEETATSATTGIQTGDNAFELGIASSNPMVHPAPNIDSLVHGTIDASDKLQLDYSTDLFPSHGIRVYRNNQLLSTNIVNDASCLSDNAVLGMTGVAALLYGLTHQDNQGVYDVNPDDTGSLTVNPTQMCNPGFFDFEVTDDCGCAGSNAQMDAAAPAISVAPITNGAVGRYVSLAAAARSGLVSTSTAQARVTIVAEKSRPVAIGVSGHHVVVQATDVTPAATKTSSFGPVDGKLVAKLAGHVTVTRNGRAVAAKAPDRKPPVTRATVKRHGAKATVRFRAKDASGVAATYATVDDKPLKVVRNVVQIRVKLLPHVRFWSVDVFGNREQFRKLP